MSLLLNPESILVVRIADGVGGALICLLVPVVFLLMIPISGAAERRRLRRVKMAFLRSHRKMPAEEFLRRVGAEPGLGAFYLAGRRAMAKLCRIRVERVHPEDTVRTLLDLQCDAGYIQDFVFELQREMQFRLEFKCKKEASTPLTSAIWCERGTLRSMPLGYPSEACPFADYLKELARGACQLSGTVVLRIDPRRLTNPSWSLRHELADVLFERSGALIRNSGYNKSSDGQALLLYLRAERLMESLPCIEEVIEHTRVLDNDLRPAVVVSVQRPGGYDVVYPPGFAGEFST
jgi:hypothetical protein